MIALKLLAPTQDGVARFLQHLAGLGLDDGGSSRLSGIGDFRIAVSSVRAAGGRTKPIKRQLVLFHDGSFNRRIAYRGVGNIFVHNQAMVIGLSVDGCRSSATPRHL